MAEVEGELDAYVDRPLKPAEMCPPWRDLLSGARLCHLTTALLLKAVKVEAERRSLPPRRDGPPITRVGSHTGLLGGPGGPDHSLGGNEAAPMSQDPSAANDALVSLPEFESERRQPAKSATVAVLYAIAPPRSISSGKAGRAIAINNFLYFVNHVLVSTPTVPRLHVFIVAAGVVGPELNAALAAIGGVPFISVIRRYVGVGRGPSALKIQVRGLID